jgi:hypothetical protein
MLSPPPHADLTAFMEEASKAWEACGLSIPRSMPVVQAGGRGREVGDVLRAAAKQTKGVPQIIFVLLPRKGAKQCVCRRPTESACQLNSHAFPLLATYSSGVRELVVSCRKLPSSLQNLVAGLAVALHFARGMAVTHSLCIGQLPEVILKRADISARHYTRQRASLFTHTRAREGQTFHV